MNWGMPTLRAARRPLPSRMVALRSLDWLRMGVVAVRETYMAISKHMVSMAPRMTSAVTGSTLPSAIRRSLGPANAFRSTFMAPPRAPTPGLAGTKFADKRVTFTVHRGLKPGPEDSSGGGADHRDPAVQLERATPSGPEPDVAEAGAFQPSAPLRRGGQPDEMRRVPRLSVPIDQPLRLEAAGQRVEMGDVDLRIVTPGDHRGVGCRREMADHGIVVHGLDQHGAAGPEHPVELGEGDAAVGVVVVAERGEPAHHGVERARRREPAQVTHEVVRWYTGANRIGLGQCEEPLGEVEPRDHHAGGGQTPGKTAVPARGIEDAGTRFQLQQAQDLGRIVVGVLLVDRLLVEVEVVITERGLDVKIHAAS